MTSQLALRDRYPPVASGLAKAISGAWGVRLRRLPIGDQLLQAMTAWLRIDDEPVETLTTVEARDTEMAD